MKNAFNTNKIHIITNANTNYYANPFIHPARKMAEHDFIYMLDGEWKIGQNDEIFELKKDSLLILSANNRHYGVAPCTAGTKTMYFHVKSETGDFLTSEQENTTDTVFVDTLIDASKNKAIKRYFSSAVNAFLSGNNRKANLYFELLLCELENNLGNIDTEIAEGIKRRIHSSPEKFYSNRELANIYKVSVKTAENKFKEKFGVTIHKYILDFKIKEAIHYFDMFPDISVKEVAFNLGFYDEYHFSKQFKSIMGLSPLSYKKSK